MSDTYGLLFQRLLLPAWEGAIRGRPTLSHLRELERSQWSSLDELEAFQEAELKKLVAHAWRHVPYYRHRLTQHGFEPGDFRRLEDIAKLPLLTREEAAAAQPERKSSASPLPLISKATSGTSGRPLTFAYDYDSEYWRQATKLRGYGWAGYQPGDRSLHFWGAPPLHRPRLGKRLKTSLDHALRREKFADCRDHSPAALDRIVRTIRERRPSVLVCYSQAGAALARHVVEQSARDWGEIAVIAAAEPLFPADRRLLQEAFGRHVFETYGSREVMLMAAECEAHDGLHVSMENIVLELIVREAGGERPARPGELGEVVVTDLHNFGAPFIRYLNGDCAIARAPGRCVCGRELLRLERVEGRTNDTLRDHAGRPVSGLFFNVLFVELADAVREFKIVQRRDGTIDLKLVPAASFDAALLELLRQHCARFLPGVDLRTELVSELPPDATGKRRVVVVES